MERAILVLIASAALLFSAFATGWHYGAERRQAKWDKQKLADQTEATKIREEGFELAAQYESDLNELRGKYARVQAERRRALQEKFECPASGVIGDVVVPAAVVRSMFNVTEPTPEAPGPASSEPAR
jgi:hypothetical protein